MQQFVEREILVHVVDIMKVSALRMLPSLPSKKIRVYYLYHNSSFIEKTLLKSDHISPQVLYYQWLLHSIMWFNYSLKKKDERQASYFEQIICGNLWRLKYLHFVDIMGDSALLMLPCLPRDKIRVYYFWLSFHLNCTWDYKMNEIDICRSEGVACNQKLGEPAE